MRKFNYFLLCLLLCVGCTSNESIRLNDKQEDFKEFPVNKTVQLVSISDELLEEPSQILLNGDYLIINEFNKANDAFISIYSLTEDTVVNSFMSKGNGPNEILSCHIDIADDKLWVYDMSGQRAGCLPMDSLLSHNPSTTWAKLERFYYSFAQLNDSVMLGTNDMTGTSKLSFVHLNTGEVEGKGEYAYLDDRIPSTALIDACCCYVNVNHQTKDIALAYRYTDVVEFYDSTGRLKYAIQGPDNVDIVFNPKGEVMGKTPETRKAFVNSYATENYLYLLYSGCKRTDENWSYGSRIFVYSWDGKPQKCYTLDRPVYTFAVDEENQVIYSYSIQTDELLKGDIS